MPLSFQVYSVLMESSKNSQLKNASMCAFFARKRTFQLVIIPNISQIHFTPDFSFNCNSNEYVNNSNEGGHKFSAKTLMVGFFRYNTIVTQTILCRKALDVDRALPFMCWEIELQWESDTLIHPLTHTGVMPRTRIAPFQRGQTHVTKQSRATIGVCSSCVPRH